jgi:hypothetical protein
MSLNKELKMKTFTIIVALVVLGCIAFKKNCFADDSDAGVNLDINLGIAVYDTEGKEKPKHDCEVEPAVFAEFQYTFDGGNQIYIGTPFENDGEPTVGASFGNGLVDVSAFYISPEDVYKDPYITEREETTEAGFGGKIALNVKSFKAGYELRHTEVKEDEIAKRFKELSREVFIHNLSASYQIELGGQLFIEPGMDVTYAMNNAKENNSDGDDWAEKYRGANIGLSLTKMFGNVIVFVSAKVGENQYANDDPIFGADRVDNAANLTGAIQWLAPFGYEKYSAMVAGGMESNDSSIEFYDRDEVYGFMSVGYHF